jgi:hypothetical protein
MELSAAAVEHLRKLVAYSLDEERNAWEQDAHDEGHDVEHVYDPTACPDHIYHSVKALDELLDATPISPATALPHGEYEADLRITDEDGSIDGMAHLYIDGDCWCASMTLEELEHALMGAAALDSTIITYASDDNDDVYTMPVDKALNVLRAIRTL